MVNSRNEYPFLEGETRYNWESVVPGKKIFAFYYLQVCVLAALLPLED